MVLQREKPVIIWGSADPGQWIEAVIQGKRAVAQANMDGSWELRLPPLDASNMEHLILTSDDETVVIEDVAVGEVFVAGGQSNMEFWMRYEKHLDEVKACCKNNRVRYYDVPKLAYEGQEYDFDYSRVGFWRKSTIDDIEFFSAIGWYFADKLNKELDVPIGVIGCNWGGTRSLAWMSKEKGKVLQPEETAEFLESLKGEPYEKMCKEAGKNPMNDSGNSSWTAFCEFFLPRTPSDEEIEEFLHGDGDMSAYDGLPQPNRAPGSLYKHMVLRIAPYTVRGVLWYQGESDDEIDGTQYRYKEALKAIIHDWRVAFQSPELPFFIVQLPGFKYWMGCACHDFPKLRSCQQEVVAEDDFAYLCSISDAGEEYDIHPKDKRTPGLRLASLALRHLYHMDILADAPIPSSVKRDGNRIEIKFENTGDGLQIQGENVTALHVYCMEEEVPHFASVCGDNLILQVDCDEKAPLVIEFAKTCWYMVNLYNSGFVPAIPFILEV